MRIAPFPYFGSKARPAMLAGILPHLDGSTLYEPYAGSLAVSINWALADRKRRWIATEARKDVYEVHKWLARQTHDSLTALAKRAGLAIGQPAMEVARGERGAASWLALTCCAMVGAATRETTPIRREPPIDATIAALPAYQQGEVIFGFASARHAQDLAFIDPPYHGTVGGYDSHGDVKRDVADIVAASRLSVVTYGEGADKLWPNWDWSVLIEKSVAGYTVPAGTKRRDWIAKVCRIPYASGDFCA